MQINLNDSVWVQLTDRGLEILRAQHDELAQVAKGLPPWKPPATDEDGWSKWQLWTLFDHFGIHIHMGPPLPFSATIMLSDPTLEARARGWEG